MAKSPSPSRSPSAKRRVHRERSRSPLQDKQSRSPARSPLQEKSSSETNVSRPGKDKKLERDIFATTPFPTKPQHVLLPSTIRKQKSFQNAENYMPGHFGRSQLDDRTMGLDTTRRAPVLQLKKSVTTLRDMYEAHEKSSRPSTATSSPALRPMSSNPRLRSVSSSDGLSGRAAWGLMHKVSSDDMALLPSLNEITIRQMNSQSSFASRMARTQPLTSSPNYRVLGFTSPKMPVFRDEPSLSSDLIEASSSSDAPRTISSTPNFVRLGRSSSIGGSDTVLESSSSPIVVKLGTSSPMQQQSSSPTPSTASRLSLKRKRDIEENPGGYPSRPPSFTSSPPYPVHEPTSPLPQSPDSLPMDSSPPQLGTAHSVTMTSPNFRVPTRSSSESFSSASHASLQAALSSSPMPPIQYPVVRAPVSAGQSLSIPKRISRGAQLEGLPSSSRLSPIPSIWEERLPSARSVDSHGESTDSESDRAEESGNESQIRIINDDHSHEASDELSALPRPPFRSPPMVPVRTNSLYGTLTNSSTSVSLTRLNSLRHSMDSRLTSMRSFSHSRQNSIISNTVRPTSSGSINANAMVPTWARRYYSGFYRDSFQYLYSPSQNGSAAQLPYFQHDLRPQRSVSFNNSVQVAELAAPKDNRLSIQSIRNSLRHSFGERLPSLFRSRLQARESHLTIGVGPLVSNPTQPEAVALATDTSPIPPTVRRVSSDQNLPPVDPRAHWAGITASGGLPVGHPIQQIPKHSVEVQRGRPSAESESVYYSASLGSNGMPSRFRFLPSAHLHRDQRLNTGSSTSRGYGHPFNHKVKFLPYVADGQSNGYGRPSWFSLDLHSTQVFLFIGGFVCPILWFVASLLPLPRRPASYPDLEKAEWESATVRGSRPMSEWEEIDVVARLRMERHLRGLEEVQWQNSRWWRRMNRCMSIVGIVIIVIVVVLAVIGAHNGL